MRLLCCSALYSLGLALHGWMDPLRGSAHEAQSASLERMLASSGKCNFDYCELRLKSWQPV
jgi:hypothetical protein